MGEAGGVEMNILQHSDIESCKIRIKELQELIRPLNSELFQLEKWILESKSKFKPGDIITWNEGNRRGRVIDIIKWVSGDPMWRVVRINKNGQDGAVCKVHSYDNPVMVSKP